MTSSLPIIEVSGLTKNYRIYRSSADVLRERLFGKPCHEIFRALDDINLTVFPGEVLGVMGPNGAGKSTLLKIITGVLKPSLGAVRVRGRVSAILELGTGFSPEKTGRENIRMGCLVLGMSPEEIRKKTEGIIAFSELESFIDRPFHTYSSGMQARLAFSVAISPDPEVLIVDEALAVGDAKFQQKCFGRLLAMRQSGTSILLVTHDSNTIGTFCNRAVILMGGKLVAEGSPANMVPEYLRRLSLGAAPVSVCVEAPPLATGDGSSRQQDPVFASYGDGRVEIQDFALEDNDGRPVRELASGQKFRFWFRFRAKMDISDFSPAFAIRDRRAVTVFGLSAITRGMRLGLIRAGESQVCLVKGTMWLAQGQYGLVFGIGDGTKGGILEISDQKVFFDVVGPLGNFTTNIVNLDASFSVRSSS